MEDTAAPDQQRRTISTTEAATRLGVAAITVRRWHAEGKLTGYRRNGRGPILIDESSVAAMIMSWQNTFMTS